MIVIALYCVKPACLFLRFSLCRLFRYNVTQSELTALLCRIADELLFRQIVWLKRLPFYSDLSIKDCTRLLGASWHQLILLSSLTVHSGQILGELANITHQYTPSSLTLQGYER